MLAELEFELFDQLFHMALNDVVRVVLDFFLWIVVVIEIKYARTTRLMVVLCLLEEKQKIVSLKTFHTLKINLIRTLDSM